MKYAKAREVLPQFVVRHVYDFEARIENAVRAFASSLPAGARVLDAGAGEGRHAGFFGNQRYTAVDLGIGDSQWDYTGLDVVADLGALPFRDEAFDAALNIVTLEHLKEPARALAEISRVLRSGARILVVAPHEWEVHQAPNDYFRYTRHGLEYLLQSAGFRVLEMEAAGGLFRLLSRRLLNAVQVMPPWMKPLGVLLLAPPALILPVLEPLDRKRDFTLGYKCTAQKS
jgi:SAM-dependent methyltransferase